VGNNGGVSPSATVVRGGVVAAIALAVLGAAFATPWIVTLNLPSWGHPNAPMPSMPPITVAPQERTTDDRALGQTLEMVGAVLVGLLLAALVALAVYRLLRRLRAAWRPDESEVEPGVMEADVPSEAVSVDLASLATALARARAHLEGHAEPSDAVVAAWVALEDEAALQGTARQPFQTATEFTSVLLQHSPAPPDAVATLRELYHRARFTSRPVTAKDVLRARDALDRITQAIDASPWARP
jgi:hypothetical protein